jgi:hypothetical protein
MKLKFRLGARGMSNKLSFDPSLGVGSGRRMRQRQAIKILSVFATTVATALQLFQINPADWFAQDPKLFPDVPVVKGASPTLDSLELKNEESRHSLESYVKYRDSDDREDLDLATRSLRKALRNERGTAPPETVAYLEALEGQLQLHRGDWKAAIQLLDDANRLRQDDPFILNLLVQAYDEANLKLQAMDDWSPEVRDRIRTFTRKAAQLRRELRRLQARDLVNRPGEALALAPGLRCAENCTSANPDPDLAISLVAGARGSYEHARVNDINQVHFQVGSEHVLLAVGINDYGLAASGFQPLTYAVRDAVRVAGGYARASYTTHVVTDTQATRENILDALLHATSMSQPGDDFVFYFSGHGFTDVRGKSAIVTASMRQGGVSTVTLDEIEGILSYHRGNVTVVIDGCQSRMDIDLGSPVLRHLGGTNRPTIVLAGAPGGVAVESKRLRSGLFTESLLRHIDPYAAASPPRTHDILWGAVAADTVELARKLYGIDQNPQVYRSGGLNGGK